MGLSIEGDGEAARKLRGIAERARDLRPAWPRVGAEIADAMDDQFRTSGASGGRPWKALERDYRRRKVAEGHDPATLVRTGALRASLTSRLMAVEEYAAQEATFGSDVDSAPHHGRGRRRRDILYASPELRAEITREVADYIVRGNDEVR